MWLASYGHSGKLAATVIAQWRFWLLTIQRAFRAISNQHQPKTTQPLSCSISFLNCVFVEQLESDEVISIGLRQSGCNLPDPHLAIGVACNPKSSNTELDKVQCDWQNSLCVFFKGFGLLWKRRRQNRSTNPSAFWALYGIDILHRKLLLDKID